MDYYNIFREEFKKLSDQDLINRFNKDVGKEGWVRARGEFHRALRDEFEYRDFDCSTLIEKTAFPGYKKWSLGIKIELQGKKIKFIN